MGPDGPIAARDANGLGSFRASYFATENYLASRGPSLVPGRAALVTVTARQSTRQPTGGQELKVKARFRRAPVANPNGFLTVDRNILPSPICPVLAAFNIVSTARSAKASGSTVSSLIFGRRSHGYSRSSVDRRMALLPPVSAYFRDSQTSHAISSSASFTDSSLEGWMIASSFFMHFPL